MPARLLLEPFAAGYQQRALAEILLLAVLGGLIGVHVVLRRLAFLTEALQHTVFPGIAVAYAVGASLLGGALVAAALSVLLLGLLRRSSRVDADAALGLLTATFFAFGVVVVSRRHSFQSDLPQLLFGRLLTVDHRELIDTALVVALCLIVLGLVHKELVAAAFDPEWARSQGYRTGLLDLVLHAAVALAVVAAVRALGTVLVVAFLVTPAATARLVCRTPLAMMGVAAALIAGCGWLGLGVSYDLAVRRGVALGAGALTVVLLSAVFVAVLVVSGLSARSRRRAWAEHPVEVP